jgi:hypothetical protein
VNSTVFVYHDHRHSDGGDSEQEVLQLQTDIFLCADQPESAIAVHELTLSSLEEMKEAVLLPALQAVMAEGAEHPVAVEYPEFKTVLDPTTMYKNHLLPEQELLCFEEHVLQNYISCFVEAKQFLSEGIRSTTSALTSTDPSTAAARVGAPLFEMHLRAQEQRASKEGKHFSMKSHFQKPEPSR